MSSAVDYDPDLFILQRATAVAATLGNLILNQSTLGAPTTIWDTIPAASFSVSGGYTPDENGTLIIDATSASFSISDWSPIGLVVLPGDRIRASYDDIPLFLGIVDSIERTSETDGAAHGFSGGTAGRRWTFSATAIDATWVAMHRIITWTEAIPKQAPYDTVRQLGVSVSNWPGS